jgi:hypothetical protein
MRELINYQLNLLSILEEIALCQVRLYIIKFFSFFIKFLAAETPRCSVCHGREKNGCKDCKNGLIKVGNTTNYEKCQICLPGMSPNFYCCPLVFFFLVTLNNSDRRLGKIQIFMLLWKGRVQNRRGIRRYQAS